MASLLLKTGTMRYLARLLLVSRSAELVSMEEV
jgi:hypothetical protein